MAGSWCSSGNIAGSAGKNTSGNLTEGQQEAQATSSSDIDLLVELAPMDPYARVDACFGLLAELRALLEGDVDRVMVGAVKNKYLARTVERTKQPLYAA
jgi:predicted nucleotidyltransferase